MRTENTYVAYIHGTHTHKSAVFQASTNHINGNHSMSSVSHQWKPLDELCIIPVGLQSFKALGESLFKILMTEIVNGDLKNPANRQNRF